VAVHLASDAFAASAEDYAGPIAEQVLTDLPGAEVAFVAECRYAGQGYELDVPCARGAWQKVAGAFHEVHARTYGYRHLESAVEVIELRAVARRAEEAS